MTSGDDAPDPRGGPRDAFVWFLRTENGAVVFVREAASSVLTVALVGMLLFAVSGVWPPLVAVESGSMQPNMERGDLVFVMEEHRFSPGYAHGDTGIVPLQDAADNDYRKFGGYGDVVVYEPGGNNRTTPVIHRVHFWVDEGENWYDRADPDYVNAENCDELRNCPAPHAGFVTKGDNELTNDYYDQARGISSPVKPAWIRGTAEYRIPYLGWVRLTFADALAPTTTTPGGGASDVTASPAGSDRGATPSDGGHFTTPPSGGDSSVALGTPELFADSQRNATDAALTPLT